MNPYTPRNQTIEMIYEINAKNIHRKVCYLNRL